MRQSHCPPASSLTRRIVLGGLATSAACGASSAAIVNLVAVGKEGWLFPIWDEVRHTDLKRVGKVAELLKNTVDILKQAHIQVVFVLTPTKSRVYREFLPEDFKFAPDADRRYPQALEELLRAGGSAIDLLPSLMAYRGANPGEAVFFKGDTHWTAAGAQAAAAELARSIRAKVVLPASAKPGAILTPPTTLTWEKNDLAALLPPSEISKYPLEAYRIRQPAEAKGGADLIADDTADVVVVGNSFMQPKLGFASMLSNQLNRPVSLSWKVHQFGPYQTLLDYLATDAYRHRKPSLIVWNLHETDMTLPIDARDGWGQNAMPPQAFLSKLQQASAVG